MNFFKRNYLLHFLFLLDKRKLEKAPIFLKNPTSLSDVYLGGSDYRTATSSHRHHRQETCEKDMNLVTRLSA